MQWTPPDPPALFAALDATWPPLRQIDRGGWRIRIDPAGGKRVTAATALDAAADPETAAALQREAGQRPLFQIRPGEEALDQTLASRGYAFVDPVTLYAGPAAPALQDPPSRTVIFCDGPLALMAGLWASGGIGQGRLDVMARTRGTKSYLLARHRDSPAGVAYVARHGRVAMLHALHVSDQHRRAGLGRALTAAAAYWGSDQGADTIALAVTDANAPANALYTAMGMIPSGRYHYRALPT